jgi:hypothetical protein
MHPDDRMDAHVSGSERVPAPLRLGIYADAYRLRLLEALDTDFPGLHSLAGDDEFDRLGRAYIDARPSGHFSLRWYGHRLAEFLRATAPWCDHPVLAEMAAFEWAMSLAFDAANDGVISMEDMARIPPDAWGGMQLLPHASVQRLDLQWNVPVFWKAVQADDELEAPQAGEHPVGWVIWRRALNTYYRSLTVDEAWALDGLLAGNDFATLCEGLCEWVDPGNAPVHAAGLLRRWVQDGMVRDIALPTANDPVT